MQKLIKTWILSIAALMVFWLIATFAVAFIIYVVWSVIANECVATFMAYELLSNTLSLNAFISIVLLTTVYLILLIIEK